jgi:hypothetical protein
MPSIKSTLEKYDLDLLLRISRAWEVEISQRDAQSARADLFACMIQKDRFEALMNELDDTVKDAWQDLAGRGGRQTWAEFSRSNGEIRDLGAAARERENPDRHPISISETLWYGGLIGRAFFGGVGEPVEFAFIPDELLAFFENPTRPKVKISIRPAVNQSPRHVSRSDDTILDQLTDLLAANRMQRVLTEKVITAWEKPLWFMQSLLLSAGLTAKDGQPKVDALKDFFSASRDLALLQLFQSWRTAREINELRMLPGLTCDGNWQNDPLVPRTMVIEMLSALDAGTWWSISSFISTVKDVNPDFQRPAGDYDSWFIREKKTGAYLSGFASWDRVEGALLYYLLTGPLHWLGIVSLARGSAEGRFTAFQLSPLTRGMLNGESSSSGVAETKSIRVRDVRTIVLPVGTSRLIRYQVGRMGELAHASATESRFLLTVASLGKAAEQGLHIQQVLQLLEKEQPGTVPEELKRLADRWTKRGKEAGFEHAILLRFKDPSACTELVKAAGARFKFEVLNPQTLLITPAQQEGIRRLLAELGILADDQADV